MRFRGTLWGRMHCMWPGAKGLGATWILGSAWLFRGPRTQHISTPTICRLLAAQGHGLGSSGTGWKWVQSKEKVLIFLENADGMIQKLTFEPCDMLWSFLYGLASGHFGLLPPVGKVSSKDPGEYFCLDLILLYPMERTGRHICSFSTVRMNTPFPGERGPECKISRWPLPHSHALGATSQGQDFLLLLGGLFLY